MRNLAFADRELFAEFLSFHAHELSVFSFSNIYIWRGIFDISWKIIDANLCVFFTDNTGCFLYLPPLGARLSPRAVEECFKLMDGRNKNPAVSRIENVEAQGLAGLEKSGYRIRPKSGEYLCLRKTLVDLKGDSFKSKRSALNFFTKHYEARYLEFEPRKKRNCLKAYKTWAGARGASNPDPAYKGMLKDSGICLGSVLEEHEKLGIACRVVELNNKIKAFTAGFEINTEIFCVLYEFADLSIKGLSQYIFREFCREMGKYKYINIMDDSGLENLKIVKESYRPLRIIPAFIADRQS